MRFREMLRTEFDRRRATHSTYSLRRFARVLGVHHATASRLLNGDGPVTERSIHRVGAPLRIPAGRLEQMCATEREEAVLWAIGQSTFRPDTRWLASAAGVEIDRINVALQELLRTGRLRMVSERHWETERQLK